MDNYLRKGNFLSPDNIPLRNFGNKSDPHTHLYNNRAHLFELGHIFDNFGCHLDPCKTQQSRQELNSQSPRMGIQLK